MAARQDGRPTRWPPDNMFCTTYPLMCLQCAVFGLCFAAWISLTTIVLVNMMGMERLTNAFGLLTMVRGICSIIGAPLTAVVYDMTDDYNGVFHIGGVLLILAGLLFCLLHLPRFQPKRVDGSTTIIVLDTEQTFLKPEVEQNGTAAQTLLKPEVEKNGTAVQPAPNGTAVQPTPNGTAVHPALNGTAVPLAPNQV